MDFCRTVCQFLHVLHVDQMLFLVRHATKQCDLHSRNINVKHAKVRGCGDPAQLRRDGGREEDPRGRQGPVRHREGGPRRGP